MNPNDAQPLPASRGLPQMSPAMSGDVDRLREDFRTFVADCQTLFRNATNLSGEGATACAVLGHPDAVPVAAPEEGHARSEHRRPGRRGRGRRGGGCRAWVGAGIATRQVARVRAEHRPRPATEAREEDDEQDRDESDDDGRTVVAGAAADCGRERQGSLRWGRTGRMLPWLPSRP